MAAAFFGIIAIGIHNETNAPTEGTVIEKKYIPEDEYTTYKTVYSNGERIRVPVKEHESEKYVVTIKGKNKKGNIVKYSFYVSESEYNEIQLGQHYVRKLGE